MTDDLHTLDGPLLLLAGPGTGKTYRLARRLKRLAPTAVDARSPPDNVGHSPREESRRRSAGSAVPATNELHPTWRPVRTVYQSRLGRSA